MRSLFSSSEQRRLELIELLIERDGSVNMAEAATILDCSDRILATDVDVIAKMCPHINISRVKKQIFMNFEGTASKSDIYRCFLTHNLNFQLIELIFFENDLHTDDVQKRFDISQATLYRQVNTINQTLKEYFNLTLETNPLQLVGKESTIRNFYFLYFSEKYSFQDWPFPATPYHSLDNILKMIENVTGDRMYFGSIYHLKIRLAINTVRLNQSKFLENYDSEMFLNTFVPSFVHTLALKNFRATLPSIVQEIEGDFVYHELFYPYVSDTIIFDYRIILRTIQHYPQFNLNLMKIHRLIHQLQEEFDLEMDNLSEFIIEVNNTIQSVSPELKRGYIIDDSVQPLFDYYHTEFPDFFNRTCELTNELLEGLSAPGYFLYDSVIQAILTTWKNLPLQLQKDATVKIVLINAHSTSMMDFYRELLYFELPQPVDIKVWRDYPFSRESVIQSDGDIIVSNIHLPEIDGKEIIYGDNLALPQTLDKIIEAILKVRHQRNIMKEGTPNA